jgi:hypothetical protein
MCGGTGAPFSTPAPPPVDQSALGGRPSAAAAAAALHQVAEQVSTGFAVPPLAWKPKLVEPEAAIAPL